MDQLPSLGLGTGTNRDPDACAESVTTALEVGYRHIDTAQSYGNESGVGAAITRSDVPREEVFVATKIRDENLGYDDVLESVDGSLARLGIETIDLLYVHTPRTRGEYDASETLPAFDELYDRGVIRHIGVANFSTSLLDEALDVLDAPLFAHQAELHPLLQQNDLLEHARKHEYTFVAHTPVLRGDVYDVAELSAIAEKHDATEAQVSLAWLLGTEPVHVVAGAETPAEIREDDEALDLTLDEADVARIEGIERERRLCDWDDGPWNW